MLFSLFIKYFIKSLVDLQEFKLLCVWVMIVPCHKNDDLFKVKISLNWINVHLFCTSIFSRDVSFVNDSRIVKKKCSLYILTSIDLTHFVFINFN